MVYWMQKEERQLGQKAAARESMEYRNWEKLSLKTSLLGYGCMRFPTTPEGHIDEARAEALLNAARDAA